MIRYRFISVKSQDICIAFLIGIFFKIKLIKSFNYICNNWLIDEKIKFQQKNKEFYKKNIDLFIKNIFKNKDLYVKSYISLYDIKL